MPTTENHSPLLILIVYTTGKCLIYAGNMDNFVVIVTAVPRIQYLQSQTPSSTQGEGETQMSKFDYDRLFGSYCVM